jgi:transposase
MLPENLADKVYHPLGINAWGCISARGVGTLMTFEETLNGAYMLKILNSCLFESRDKLFPDGDWYFQQDNARSHIDSKVERWLFDKNIPLIIMPPYSPDLNPIELVWARLKPIVHNRFTKSIDELSEVVIEEWNALNSDFLRNIVHAMPERISKVIKAQGQRIK